MRRTVRMALSEALLGQKPPQQALDELARHHKRDRKFADSLLEEAGFEPSVPREAPRILVVSVLVRPDFSACGNQAEVT